MPDRVSDAPIPEDLKQLYIEAKATDIKTVWEGRVVAELIRRVARLEAEKQAAHTEGWNAAIQAAAKAADSVYPEHIKGNPLVSVLTCPGSVLEGAVRLIRVLSKPTAAKPEPSPSSANRAKGRQG